MKKKIVRAIRIVWESVDSHLDPAIDKRITGKVIGSRAFHKKTVKEYMEVLDTLIDLL